MQRNTKQKKLVFNALTTLCHPTAQDIYDFISKEYPQISLGTVYRILSSFCNQKKILHIKIPNKADCYDYQTHNHYHFCCKKCLKVYDMDIPYLAHLNTNLNGYMIEEHNILFSGICADCQNNKEGK